MPATLAISALRVASATRKLANAWAVSITGSAPRAASLLGQLGVLRGRLHGGVELRHQLRRHALRAPQRIPEHEGEARESGLGDGRHRRQLRGTPLGHHGEGAQAARLDLLERAAERGDHERRLPSQDIGERRCRAAVGDDNCLDADAVVEARGGEVPHRAEARVRVRVLVRVGLHLGRERRKIAGRLGRMADEHQGRGGQPRDGREVRDRVVGDPPHDVLRHEVDVGVGEQRSAVGRRPRHLGGAQRVAGTWAVLHDPALAERVLHAVGKQPADDIDIAAGCSGNDQAHVAALLGECRP